MEIILNIDDSKKEKIKIIADAKNKSIQELFQGIMDGIVESFEEGLEKL